MDLTQLFKSVIEQDKAPVVICDLNHTIVYMNRAAIKSYTKNGGENLMGKSIFVCHNEKSRQKIMKVMEWFSMSKENNIVFETRNQKENKDVYMVALRDENENLIGYYEKHEYRTPEDNKPYGNIEF